MPTGVQETITAVMPVEYPEEPVAPAPGYDALLPNDQAISSGQDLQSRAEWQLALRIASSKGLCKSSFLPNFLLYICEQHLIGNAQEITEQRIGTKIFHRASNYNPGEDNIVRSYARLLRKRLDEYFEQEGHDEPVRLIIPRGGYVPIFEGRAEISESFAAPAPVADEEPEDPATASLPGVIPAARAGR